MTTAPARLLCGMIDLHCHLLPGIDDGAKDLQQALNMARIAVADGIAVAVMTPHHLNGVYDNPAATVREQVATFSAELQRAGTELEILPGAECHLVPEISQELADGKAMTVADRGKAVMVELPVHTIPMGATSILEEIQILGLTPIIVHPERNAELRQKPERLREWVAMGCLAQVTAQACTGRFGESVRRAAHHMVTRGLIHFVASDAHRDHRRVPQLRPGRAVIEQWTSPEVGQLLTEEFPRALVAGRLPATEKLMDALDASRQAPSIWERFRGLSRVY